MADLNKSIIRIQFIKKLLQWILELDSRIIFIHQIHLLNKNYPVNLIQAKSALPKTLRKVRI